MAEPRSGGIVAGLTVAVLVTVAVLAHQASGTWPPSADRLKLPGRTTDRHVQGARAAAAGPPVPENSGRGRRVVYAPEQRRVWLVGEKGRAERTYEVVPSGVSPVPGRYRVLTRTGRTMGSDGVPVEHVVRFASLGQTVIGFSSALREPSRGNDEEPTGGIRQSREDGLAMWEFAGVGMRVVVVE